MSLVVYREEYKVECTEVYREEYKVECTEVCRVVFSLLMLVSMVEYKVVFLPLMLESMMVSKSF